VWGQPPLRQAQGRLSAVRRAKPGCFFEFIRATSQLNAGTILGPGFFTLPRRLNPG